jgi:hypothetical protein
MYSSIYYDQYWSMSIDTWQDFDKLFPTDVYTIWVYLSYKSLNTIFRFELRKYNDIFIYLTHVFMGSVV